VCVCAQLLPIYSQPTSKCFALGLKKSNRALSWVAVGGGWRSQGALFSTISHSAHTHTVASEQTQTLQAGFFHVKKRCGRGWQGVKR